MNSYKAKKIARKSYLSEKAEKLKKASETAYNQSNSYIAHIPLGQPVLAGHHSEKSHRKALDNSHRAMHKAVQLQKKADYYESKANKESRAISSDDEDAILRLKDKLLYLEQRQIDMKRINKEFKKNGAAVVKGLSEEYQKEILTNLRICPWEKVPFPSYELKSNNAKIRQVKERLVQLEEKKNQIPNAPIEEKGFIVTEHYEDNRIWFQFDEKPSQEICKLMRQQGFKFSVNRDNAWIRMLNAAGRSATERLIQELRLILK